jgi:hypothetical protein
MSSTTESTDANNKNIQCPVCTHLNRTGSLVCENCGTLLDMRRESRRATRDLRDGESELSNPEKEALATPAAGEKIRGAGYTQGQAIHLRIDESKYPLIIAPEMLKGEIVIGRRDPITEKVPEVDLDRYAGYRMGVSRRHAVIHLTGGQLMLTDMGSSNGTFLNGKRLRARQPEPVLDNDLVRFGQIIATVKFVEVQSGA